MYNMQSLFMDLMHLYGCIWISWFALLLYCPVYILYNICMEVDTLKTEYSNIVQYKAYKLYTFIDCTFYITLFDLFHINIRKPLQGDITVNPWKSIDCK